jgi:hypothetical protein
VKRLQIVYLIGFVTAVLLFATYARLGQGARHVVADDEWSLGFVRFVVFALGVGCAAATWFSAVWLAMLHRRVWPLAVALVAACGASASVVFAR